jgi:hypothetical protein
MKGKSPKLGPMKREEYNAKGANVYKEAEKGTDGFKKGGKIGMKSDGVMSEAHAGRKPRKSGGGVLSAAASGSPRGKASCY